MWTRVSHSLKNPIGYFGDVVYVDIAVPNCKDLLHAVGVVVFTSDKICFSLRFCPRSCCSYNFLTATESYLLFVPDWAAAAGR